jgi:glycosyltransferase involved in cell wall biosynthesis
VASRRVAFHLKNHAFSRWKYHQVDRFIAASEAIHQILVDDGIDPARIVTIYEGIDVDRVQAEPPVNMHAELWLPTNAPLVGAIGALTQEKGHRHLIDAAALAVREVPDARFVILGEGDQRRVLERHIKELHLEKHVLLPGFRPDIIGCIRGFDLIVMPSLQEGLGTSLLDAMAAGKATVATRTGGIPEVVADGQTGMLVPPRDTQALATAITELLQHADRREAMGRAGLARVKKIFSAERMVERTLEAYRACGGLHHADERDIDRSTGTASPPARG